MLDRFDWWDPERGAHVIAEKNRNGWRYFEKESVRWWPLTPTPVDRRTLRSFLKKRKRASSTSA